MDHNVDMLCRQKFNNSLLQVVDALHKDDFGTGDIRDDGAIFTKIEYFFSYTAFSLYSLTLIILNYNSGELTSS